MFECYYCKLFVARTVVLYTTEFCTYLIIYYIHPNSEIVSIAASSVF